MKRSGGDIAEVPLAWLCAEDSASRLLVCSQAPWSQASFEYRAAHDVLALTLVFTCPPGPPADLGTPHALLADDTEWALWCHARLDTGLCSLQPADKRLAVRAFRGLTSSRLVGGSLDQTLEACAVTVVGRGAGVSVGVASARRVLDPWAEQNHPGRGTNVA